jgi:hypothetical protein
MAYTFNTDRSGRDWTQKDLTILEQATRRDIETLESQNGMDPAAARTDGGHWWSWPFFEPTEKTVLEVAKKLKRPPGSIRAKMLQLSDEFFVDPAQLKKANRTWQTMSRAAKREFVQHKLKSNSDMLKASVANIPKLDVRKLSPPDQFDEKKFVEDAVWRARREAREQALAILEAHSGPADDDLKRRIRSLKRQLGIQQTVEEKRAATRERVRQHRERMRHLNEHESA